MSTTIIEFREIRKLSFDPEITGCDGGSQLPLNCDHHKRTETLCCFKVSLMLNLTVWHRWPLYAEFV